MAEIDRKASKSSKAVGRRMKARQVSYWTLTPYGDSVMTKLRAIKKSPETTIPETGSLQGAGPEWAKRVEVTRS